jgi:hypothetical protein
MTVRIVAEFKTVPMTRIIGEIYLTRSYAKVNSHQYSSAGTTDVWRVCRRRGVVSSLPPLEFIDEVIRDGILVVQNVQR